VSQMPDMTAAEWPEQSPGGTPYPQVDTEPHQVEQDWGAPQPQAPAQWSGYQGYQEEEPAVVPTEFDHLFRDSPQDTRKSIDRSRPMVGGASVGFLDAAPQYETPQPQYAAPQQVPPPAQLNPAQTTEYAQYTGYNGDQAASAPGQAGYPTQSVGQPVQYGYATDQPQYGAPGAPAPPGEWSHGQGAGGGGGNRQPLLIGGALVAVVAVVALIYGLSGGGSSGKGPAAAGLTTSAPATALTPKAQADQILALINESGPLRQEASGAVVNLLGCQNLAAVQTALAHTTSTRQTQAASVAKDDVSGIKDGSRLAHDLQQAWVASASSDSAYAAIAADMQNSSCSSAKVKRDPNYAVAQQQGDVASENKYTAAQLWNTDVTSLGEGTITSDQL
jgi:hypothetical protein